ncbi:MAG: hypothetical protein H6Q82_279 [Deltaproteobacteria bacterium]|nr:hypothetical protein [Deltaproteobacteria bacterium]
MENSRAPRSFAPAASRKISSPDRRGYLPIPAPERLDCAQKEQSSEQSPDFALTMSRGGHRPP